MTAGNVPPNPCYAYELLDFGGGRKLERFGGRILDRPCPAAESFAPESPEIWAAADFRFAEDGKTSWSSVQPEGEWTFDWEALKLELRFSPFGHVGLFPEQIANWRWLIERIRRADRRVTVLNLFGYTGGSTLASASAGAEVVHVDASQPTVRWARRNAELSRLDDQPIRWIVDDVRDFVERERRRGTQYDIIAMDPPAYGHGSDGKHWKIETDLDPLIEDCVALLSEHPIAFLLTGHSPIRSLETGPIAKTSWSKFERKFTRIGRHRVGLFDRRRRKLDMGYAYRLSRDE